MGSVSSTQPTCEYVLNCTLCLWVSSKSTINSADVPLVSEDNQCCVKNNSECSVLVMFRANVDIQ